MALESLAILRNVQRRSVERQTALALGTVVFTKAHGNHGFLAVMSSRKDLAFRQRIHSLALTSLTPIRDMRPILKQEFASRLDLKFSDLASLGPRGLSQVDALLWKLPAVQKRARALMVETMVEMALALEDGQSSQADENRIRTRRADLKKQGAAGIMAEVLFPFYPFGHSVEDRARQKVAFTAALDFLI